MTDISEPGAGPDDPTIPIEPPRPKRGAFPSPKSEIEKAKRYVPDVGEVDDSPDTKSVTPTDVEGEKEG